MRQPNCFSSRLSRSKCELDIVVSLSAFENLNDLAKHVADRISLKTTTQTFNEVLERTGGRETIRVHNMETQRDALALRRLYEAEVVEPLRALQLERVDQAREAYRARKRELAESGLSMEERLETGKDALRAMRTTVAAAYQELRPQPFGEWLVEREERRERVRSSVDRRKAQEQAIQRELTMGGEFSRLDDASQTRRLYRER